MNWRNRVTEMRRVSAAELNANPKNWREHPPEQESAIKGVLDEVGIASALLARETPNGLELIDGHLRTQLDDGTEWPVLILDVDQREADILLASLDPIGALASSNQQMLDDLMEGFAVGNQALDGLLESLKTPDDWEPPKDFSDLDEYDAEKEDVVIKITVPLDESNEVAEAIRTTIADRGWPYKVGAF